MQLRAAAAGVGLENWVWSSTLSLADVEQTFKRPAAKNLADHRRHAELGFKDEIDKYYSNVSCQR